MPTGMDKFPLPCLVWLDGLVDASKVFIVVHTTSVTFKFTDLFIIFYGNLTTKTDNILILEIHY